MSNSSNSSSSAEVAAAAAGPAYSAAELSTALGKLHSKTIKSWVEKLQSGDYGVNRVIKGLQKTIADTRKMISNSNSPNGGRKLPADADRQVEMYRDALIVLAVLEGGTTKAAAHSAKTNAARVSAALAPRVAAAQAGKKTERKLKAASAALSRKVEKAKSAAADAASRLAALERGEMPAPSARTAATAASKEIIPANSLARLVRKYGRDEDKAAMIAKVLAKVPQDATTPRYITDVVAAIESQVLRFSSPAKKRLMLQIRTQMTKLEGQRDILESEGKLKPAKATEYNSKLKALERLLGLVEAETNVEMSNASKASTASTRRRRVHTRMACKKLRHPCNSKIVVTKEQLKAAVDEIMEKGWATPIPGTEGRSMAPSQASTRAASPVANNSSAETE